MTVPETSKTVYKWGDDTFGQAKSVKAYALRAQEELTELIEAIDQGQSSKEIVFEAADVTILLHRLAGTLGYDLSETVDRKMEINRNRTWNNAGDGTGQHS